MIGGRRVAVVVPAYNEQAWIADVLANVPASIDLVVVVDDASGDDTVRIAQRAACPAPVEVLRQPINCGVGAAIVRGYGHALERGADVLVVIAGDGQMDPGDLPALIAPVVSGQLDYVKGNRLRHADVWRVMPSQRRVGSYLLSMLTSAAIGQVIGDSQCGYTALSGAAFARLDAAALWHGYGYPNDLLGALRASGARIGEVTVRPVYRGEASGMRIWHAAVIMGLIARVRWRRVRWPTVRSATMRSATR